MDEQKRTHSSRSDEPPSQEIRPVGSGEDIPTALPADLAELIPGVIWITDSALQFTWIAGRALLLSDTGAHEVIGRPLADVLERGGVRALAGSTAPVVAHERALAGFPLTHYQVVFDTFELRCYVAPIIVDGTPAGCFGCAFSISGEAPAATEKLTLDLRSSSGAGSVSYLLADGDRNGSLVRIGSNIEDLIGLSAEELLGEPGLLAERVHRDDREHLARFRADTLNDGEPRELDYRMIAWGGEIITVHDRFCRSSDENGSLGIAGSLTLLRRGDVVEERALLIEAQAERILAMLELRGLPSGTWLYDVSRARDDMKTIDRLLYRLEQMLVNERRDESEAPPRGD